MQKKGESFDLSPSRREFCREKLKSKVKFRNFLKILWHEWSVLEKEWSWQLFLPLKFRVGFFCSPLQSTPILNVLGFQVNSSVQSLWSLRLVPEIGLRNWSHENPEDSAFLRNYRKTSVEIAVSQKNCSFFFQEFFCFGNQTTVFLQSFSKLQFFCNCFQNYSFSEVLFQNCNFSEVYSKFFWFNFKKWALVDFWSKGQNRDKRWNSIDNNFLIFCATI